MKINKLLMSAVFAAVVTSASGFEASVILPVASKHFSSDTIPNSDRPYNSRNTGGAVSLRPLATSSTEYNSARTKTRTTTHQPSWLVMSE